MNLSDLPWLAKIYKKINFSNLPHGIILNGPEVLGKFILGNEIARNLIVNNNDSYELCYSYELKNDFENLFSLRFSNHFNIYQNVNVKKWEKSFEDVFDKSDEINKFLSSDFDIDKFCKLTDSNFKLNKCNYLILGKNKHVK